MDMFEQWRSGLHQEKRFWWGWLTEHRDEVRELYARPELELKEFLRQELGPSAPAQLDIMELGPGPVPELGDTWDGRQINYVPVDALADEYREIYAHVGLAPRWNTIACHGEGLLRRFAPASFDCIYSSNALDHAHDPGLIINNLMQLLRPGGLLYLAACRNEAETQRYHGLHQWNFDMYHHRGVLWGKESIHFVEDCLGPRDGFVYRCNTPVIKGKEEVHFIVRKRLPVEEASAIPVVVLLSPNNDNDPCLAQTDEGYALDRVLAAVGQLPEVSEVLLSVSESTPRRYLNVLGSWDVQMVTSPHTNWLYRVRDIMDQRGLRRVGLLTAYSQLVDGQALGNALAKVAANQADVAHAGQVTPAKYFVVCTREAIDRHIADQVGVSPFNLASSVAKAYHHLHVAAPPQIERLAKRFLWETRYRGGNKLPDTAVALLHQMAAGQKLLEGATIQALEQAEFGSCDLASLDAVLAELTPFADVREMASQIAELEATLAELPTSIDGGQVLELGCGPVPLLSLLLGLCTRVGQVHAAEQYHHSPHMLERCKDLCRTIVRQVPAILPPGEDFQPSQDGFVFHNKALADCGLAPASVDLCLARGFFELARDPRAEAAAMASLLRPDGSALVSLNLRDRGDMRGITFGHLRHSRDQWEAVSRPYNIWRINDYVAMFAELGMETAFLERLERVVEPEDLHSSWRSYAPADLYCYHAKLRLRRTGGAA